MNILDDLLAVRDGRASFDVRARLEHDLLVRLRDSGHPALREALMSLPGLPFHEEPIEDANSVRYVCEQPGRRPLIITAYRGKHSSSINVATARPALRPVSDPRHVRFYEIWEALSEVDDIAQLDTARRAVFLIASFEAQFMNGGVGQYLANSEGAHLDAVLECLDEMGAAGTAELLRRAAAIGKQERSFTVAWEMHGDAFGEIDDKLLELGEDLAGLTYDAFLGSDSE